MNFQTFRAVLSIATQGTCANGQLPQVVVPPTIDNCPSVHGAEGQGQYQNSGADSGACSSPSSQTTGGDSSVSNSSGSSGTSVDNREGDRTLVVPPGLPPLPPVRRFN